MNSEDFFKSRAVGERKKLADVMLKNKRERYARKKLQQQARDILKKHGEPPEEKIKNYPVPAMQKLYEWKHNKKSTEGREKLLKAYFGTPVPPKERDWSMSEKIKLKELLTGGMCVKDTAMGGQLKQTAKAIPNNIDDLDKESAT